MGDEPGLVVLIVGDIADDQLSVTCVGPQPLLPASRVARDHRIGRRKNVLRRTVILLQQNGGRIGVVAFKLLDIANGGAPERVDRLIGIADYT